MKFHTTRLQRKKDQRTPGKEISKGKCGQQASDSVGER